MLSFPRSAMLLLSIAAINLISCDKAPVVTPPEEPTCRINQVYLQGEAAIYYGKNTARLYYNAAGNPDSIIMSNPYLSNDNVYFRYDKYNRLTDVIPYFSIRFDAQGKLTFVHFENWQRYYYSDDNPASLPVGDTSYFQNAWENGKFALTASYFSGKFTYDSKGRITKYDAPANQYTGIFAYNYNYDANGNLVLPGVTYDAQKNFRTGNKILMFVDRNYSVNNPAGALSYNAAGYPILFPEPVLSEPKRVKVLARNAEIISVDYLCKEGGVK